MLLNKKLNEIIYTQGVFNLIKLDGILSGYSINITLNVQQNCIDKAIIIEKVME